jgi:hypothetical protein
VLPHHLQQYLFAIYIVERLQFSLETYFGEANMRIGKPFTYGAAAVFAIFIGSSALATAATPTLPPGTTPDTWEHIMWNPANGPDADPAGCKAVGGSMKSFGGFERCFLPIKAWLAQAPGNVVAELCMRGQGQALPALMTAKDVQLVKSNGMLAWTSADGVPYGYEQAAKCRGK